MRLNLNLQQKALWLEIAVSFYCDAVYDDDAIVAPEECVSDFMMC